MMTNDSIMIESFENILNCFLSQRIFFFVAIEHLTDEINQQ